MKLRVYFCNRGKGDAYNMSTKSVVVRYLAENMEVGKLRYIDDYAGVKLMGEGQMSFDYPFTVKKDSMLEGDYYLVFKFRYQDDFKTDSISCVWNFTDPKINQGVYSPSNVLAQSIILTLKQNYGW